MKRPSTIKSALETIRDMHDAALRTHDEQIEAGHKRRAAQFFGDAMLLEKIEEVLCWVLDEEFPGKAIFGHILGQSCDEPDVPTPGGEPSNN